MWLVDLNYNFQCDWLIELSDNNFASASVEKKNWNYSQSRKLKFLWLLTKNMVIKRPTEFEQQDYNIC